MSVRKEGARGLQAFCLTALSPMSLLLLYALPPALPITVQLVENCNFDTWTDGEPAGWEVMMEQGTALACSCESIEGDSSVQMHTTDSYDIYLRQGIWIDESVRGSVVLEFIFRIDEIDDVDSAGQHSLTGLEIGLEGGDIDGDGQPEYMYHYFFTDKCVRVEDFPAWQYNTTPVDAPHKSAFLHQIDSVGVWNTFQCNISQLFLQNLGGLPHGAIDLRLWALRWGDGKPDSGIRATIDSVSIWVSEKIAMAILVLGAIVTVFRPLLAKADAG